MAKNKNSGLGRGLDSIFLDNSIEESKGGITMLRLSDIEPNPDQPRKDFGMDELSSLAQSISVHGLIQPLVVRTAKSDGYYQIIAGERRWRACKMAGLSEVPAIIMDADDLKASQLALIENVQREDLNPIEEASALKALLESYGMTQEELSRSIGRSRSAIANMMRLLDLPPKTIHLIRTGELTTGHGKALLGLRDKEEILPATDYVMQKALSVRQTESYVRQKNEARIEASKPKPQDIIDIDYADALAARMAMKLCRMVKIVPDPKCRHIEIGYTDDEDLDVIVRSLCGPDVFDAD